MKNTIKDIIRSAFAVSVLILPVMLPAASVSAAETEIYAEEAVSSAGSEFLTEESAYAAEAAVTQEAASGDAAQTGADFQTIVSYAAPIYTDPLTGVTYTQTLSGATVEVSGTSYLNALASGNEETYLAILRAQTSSFYWDGSYLTELAGINYGPSGKETWYNLDMSPVITTLRENGYEGEYWVRSDGCKMYGLYILCAASSGTCSYGSLVETSLGTGIIADSGCGAGIIDIATAW